MCPFPPPEPPHPPKRIRQRSSNPSACQKIMKRQPKSGGSSQFHKRITISPPITINASIARIASGAIQIHFLLMFPSSSPFDQFLVNALQPLAQMQHGVAL